MPLLQVKKMKRSKYRSKIQTLSKKPLFTAAQAQAIGIPARMLAHFSKIGMVERISRGVYRVKDSKVDIGFEWEDLALIAMSIPKGVICLISALCYYELTDQIMREFWIAVPHASKSPKRPNTRIVRMRNMRLGQTEIILGNCHLKIFDRERTVIDAFRYLSKEIAIKALQSYLYSKGKQKSDFRKLEMYAKTLRVNIGPYIMALTT